jgi:HPt (histidine-containing phosphotransfer) domain-containing protein
MLKMVTDTLLAFIASCCRSRSGKPVEPPNVTPGNSPPGDILALATAIERAGGEPARMDPPAAPDLAPRAADTLFDPESFVERLMGNEDLAQEIVRGFVDDMPLQLARLVQALNDQDASGVRLVAHSIKGAAANVSGLELERIAWKLEQTGSAGNLAGAAAVLPELSASFERLRPVMEKFYQQDPSNR